MRRKKFPLRKKPVEPQLKDFLVNPKEKEVASGGPLDLNDLIAVLDDCPDPNAHFELEYSERHCYYESDRGYPCIILHWDEPAEAEFDLAVAKYKKHLASYEAWSSKNEKAITIELFEREADKKAADLKKAEQLEKKAKGLRRRAKQ